jgi:ABC-type nitrate/sulfonate/bicarbonate transport system substrate-binding protein
MAEFQRFTRYSVLLLVLSLVLPLAACVAPAARPAALTKVSLRLDWTPGAQHSPFYLGKDKGFYSAEGIDLNIIGGSGSSDAIKQLGAHAVDLALLDGLVLVQGKEQGVPVKAVGTYYQRTPITLLSPVDKPVNDVSDLLKGVKLGSKKGSSTYQGLIALLATNNIKLEQIKMVDIGVGVQPLLAGQVDAMMGFTMNEPVEVVLAGMKVHELLIADHGVTAYGLTIASNDQFMKDHPDLIKGFLRATKKAMAAAASDHQAAVDAVVKAIPDLKKDHELKVLEKTVDFWSGPDTKDHSYLWQTEAAWSGTSNTAMTLGLIKKQPATADLYTVDYLK